MTKRAAQSVRASPCTPPSSATDARRERVLAAATELLRDQGVNASLEEVARRAGVGIGTVYRKFPTRADLLATVYEPAITSWATCVDDGLHHDDPCRALSDVYSCVAELQFDYRGFADVMTMPFPSAPEFEDTRMRAVAGMRTLALRAKRRQCLQRDYSPRDFLIFIMANEGIVQAGGDIARQSSQRLLSHFLRSIMVEPQRKLAPAPDLDEVIVAMQRLRGIAQ